MAALSTNHRHRTADATHAALLDEEKGPEASALAIAAAVQAARTGAPLPPD